MMRSACLLLCLCGHVLGATWLSSVGGPDISALYTQINAALTTLGGGHQLTPVNLTAFPAY